MAQPNRTRQALLGFLTWGSLSGYSIRKLIDGSISNFWSESPGRVYPMLNQLAADGLADKREQASDGGRALHTYSITERGREAFREWLAEPVAPRPLRNELLLKVFFAARTDRETARGWIESFQTEQLEAKSRYAEIRAELEAVKDAPPDTAYWLLSLDYGEREVAAHLDWCREALRELSRDPKRSERAR